jgi:hypothetical protein
VRKAIITARVILHEQAVAQARAARPWYEERSSAAAEASMEELDHAMVQTAEFPEGWSP